MHKFLAFALILGSFPICASTQFSRVVSDKRNIEIRASEKVTVPAEIAIVKVGFQNQAATKDAAYQENTKASAKIIQARSIRRFQRTLSKRKRFHWNAKMK
jgi:uncharacterized protein YggE